MPNYLTFSSSQSFSLKVADNKKHWNGTIQYSTDTTRWNSWNGTATLNAQNNGTKYNLYLRGVNNKFITGHDYTGSWVLTGSNISCEGNIENLLNYQTVASGNHPTMVEGCYGYMFYDCTSLITAPDLPATTLVGGCYDSMFSWCTSLTTPPDLPATSLADYCYNYMFSWCTSLTTPPDLPATTLADYCYNGMFYGCTGIKLSTTQTGNYTKSYRIPTSGTGTSGSDSLGDMFNDTGGTFTGTPTINTTYYLWYEAPAPSGGGVYIGDSVISGIYVGGNEVSKMYMGNELVYEKQSTV